MYLSMWIIADNIRDAQVDRHIMSGEMCIRNASVFFEAEHYRPHTIYVTGAENASGSEGDIICINKNDYFLVRGSTLEAVYEQVQDIIDRYEEWDLQVRDRIEERCCLQEVAEKGSEVLGAMTGIMDAGFIMQAVAGKQFAEHIAKDELDDLREKEGIPLSHVSSYSSFLKDHLSEKDPYIFFEPVIRSSFFTRNILLNGWLWGFCFFSTTDGNVPESRKQLFQVFYDQILLWNERNSLPAERPQQNHVFMELLTGSSSMPKEQLWDYLNRLGWAESDEKYVCAIKEHYGNSLIYLRLIHQISQTFSHCYVLELSGMIVLVVNSTHLPLDILTTQLDQILAGSNVHIGISYPFQNLMHLPQYLEQAMIALDNAQSRGIPISYCSDCAISYIKSVMQKDQNTNMEHPVLRQIRRYDARHGTFFFDTLKNYIIEERSIQRTAAALNIHKNTLLYRLRRLQELFPMDLDDSDERLRIMLSLMLY